MAIEALPLSILTMTIKHDGAMIYYPQVIGLMDGSIQQSINETIFNEVQKLMIEQQEKQDADTFEEMIGTFEIKTNERHILSLTLTNYAFAYQHANGLTLIKGLTFDTTTGKKYKLNELFKDGSDYIDVLSHLVQEQIISRDIPLIGNYEGIQPNQDFYIADKSLVLFFQSIEITPHYFGSPMFPISVFALEDIITDDGPLGRMATNN